MGQSTLCFNVTTTTTGTTASSIATTTVDPLRQGCCRDDRIDHIFWMVIAILVIVVIVLLLVIGALICIRRNLSHLRKIMFVVEGFYHIEWPTSTRTRPADYGRQGRPPAAEMQPRRTTNPMRTDMAPNPVEPPMQQTGAQRGEVNYGSSP